MKRFDPETVGAKIAELLLLEQGVASEEERLQDKLSKQIDKLKLRAPKDSDEEKITDEDEEEEGEEKEAKPDAEDVDMKAKPVPEEGEEGGEDSEGGQGEKFKVTAPSYIPTQLSINDIERQLNNLRAGKSLKDKVIAKELETYFGELGQGEQQALFTYLASLAAIMTGGTSGAAAPRPENLDVDINIDPKANSDVARTTQSRQRTQSKSKATTPSGIPVDRSAPIVVGERANKQGELMSVFENASYGDEHRCVGGRIVPFGSQRCVQDLNARIEDLVQQRDGLTRGTADRASLNGTLKFMRQKRRRADKLAEQQKQEKLQGRLDIADEL
jgi:hypothetical protein